jgi:hypothetical protein
MLEGEDAGGYEQVIAALLDRWQGRRVRVQLWGFASKHPIPAVSAHMTGTLGLLTDPADFAGGATFSVGEQAQFSISRDMAWARWKDVQAHTLQRVLYVAQNGVQIVVGPDTAS